MNSNSSISNSSMSLFSRSFLWIIGLLCLMEFIGRVFFASSLVGRFDYGYHPTAGFKETATELEIYRAGGRRFFPQTLPLIKPEGRFRAFVIGDSVPRGKNVASAYAKQLENLLNDHAKDARVYNLGVAGNGARRSQLILKQVIKYQPNLVILHMNNSNEFEDEREWQRSQEFNSWHPENWLMKSAVFRRLYELKTEKVLWRKLPLDIRSMNNISDADAEISANQNSERLEKWRKIVNETLAEKVNVLQQKKIPLLLVVQSSYQKKTGVLSKIDELEALVQLYKHQGIKSLSMADVLYEKPDSWYTDGAHINAEGHKKMALALYEILSPTME